jgi:DNA-binding NtrC family response regulator
VVSLTATPLRDTGGNASGGILVVKDLSRLVALERDLKMRHGFHNLVGKSHGMQEIYRLIEDLADISTTVLVSGESGTGKELVADALHYQGAGAEKPLVKINCAALAENLLESELFGHVKGAFSGAHRDRVGRFERAHGGTLFLDEVGLMSPAMQGRLLRVLQEKEFERVGDAAPIKVDVRVIAATNLDLKAEVAAGRFRQDLYFRLKVMELRLPPLRHRREDIPLLVEYFMAVFRTDFVKTVTGITAEAEKRLLQYSWPGNVRELRHAVEHAYILCEGQMISAVHLPEEIVEATAPVDSQKDRKRLLRALEQAHWNKTKAARILGISRQHLYRKLKQNGITEL